MEHAGFSSNGELADAVSRILKREIPRQSIQSITSGRLLSSKHAPAIAKACGVDLTWLVTGEGDMLGKGVAEGKGQYLAGAKHKRILQAARALGRALADLEPGSPERKIIEAELGKRKSSKKTRNRK